MKKFERKKGYLVNFVNRKNNKGVKNNPSNFIFFDTETNQRIEQKLIGKKTYKTVINSLQMGWAVYWDSDTDQEEWFYFENNTDFHKWLSHILLRTKQQELWIIAHNIIFDNIITDIWSFFKSRKYETEFIHSKGMVFLQKLVLKKIIKTKKKDGTIKETERHEKVITLVNNGNIFPAQLKVIGETVNLPKLEVDFDKSSKEYIKIYCKRDVEILLEFWRQWTRFISENHLGKLKFTISSQSMEAFKTKFCNEYIVLDDDLENLEFERKSYYGGRTEIFSKGAFCNPIYYYDVNAMYPYAMREFRYPVEYKFFKMNPTVEHIQSLIDDGWLVIAECNINTSNNYYPCKQNNTLLFPIGKFKTTLATPEVLEGLKNNDIESFGRVSFYKGAYIFKEYIDFFYNERLKKKAQGNKQEKMIKLFLNSLYGKFGQMMDSWNSCTVEEIKMLDPNFDLDEWIMDNYKIPKIIMGGIDMTPNIRYIGEQLQISTEKTESNISFPAIASHVTSYARLILLDLFKYCNVNNIKKYYCDTDSAFVNQKIEADFIDDTILGKMKLEKLFPYGVEFINLKNYCELSESGKKFIERVGDETNEKIMMDNEVFAKDSKVIIQKGSAWKMKGVPNSAQIINENTFITQEWGGLPKQEYYKKFGRKPGEFWVIYKQKINHGTINKGTLNKTNGEIKPFEMEEF